MGPFSVAMTRRGPQSPPRKGRLRAFCFFHDADWSQPRNRVDAAFHL